MTTWRSLLQKAKTYELSKSLSTGESYTVAVDQEPVKPLEVWLDNTYYGDLADDLTVTPTEPHETLTLVSFYNPVIQTVMLNSGTLPTTYSRAPEDIEADITRLEGSVKSGGQNLVLNSDFNTDKWWTINNVTSWDLISARHDSWTKLKASGITWSQIKTYNW